jgi:hypothetical protein
MSQHRGHDDYTIPQHRLEVRRLFRRFPYLRDLFGPAWISSLWNPLTPRDEVPPVFWTLANPDRNAVLAESLRLIPPGDVPGVIRELKAKDRDQVDSLVLELTLFHRLRLRNPSTVWKPTVAGSGGRSPDLSLVHDGRSVLLEAFMVRESQKDHEENEALGRLDRYINQMRNHPYLVSYEIKQRFTLAHLGRCASFLRRTIQDLTVQGTEEAERDFRVGDATVLTFSFKRMDNRKGFWASRMHGARVVEEDRRIKNKLLDKLDNFQFPRGTEELKGYVMVMEALFADYEAVLSAVLGRGAVVVYGTPSSRRTEWTRNPDGVACDPTRGKLLVDEIDFIAVMRWRRDLELLGVIENGVRRRVSKAEIGAMLGP